MISDQTNSIFLESLDLIENYLQRPRKEAANPLRSLFDRGKSYNNEYFTTDKEMESQRVKELEDENKSLKIENREILKLLGEKLVFEKMAKDKEIKSEHFHRTFRSSTPKAQPTIESIAPPPTSASVNHTVAPGQQPVLGAEALVQGGNHQPENKEMVIEDEDENEFQGGDHESNDQSSTRQGYENLPLSVQQHDSGREYISLGNIPPISVATTVYHNYKLLLLSLGQRLLSSDVNKLKDWATQNFSIDNARNAINVLFELDTKGIINASELSQLRNFFESIVRIDLVYIIDEFLLGNYSLLRQIPASKNRIANRAQNPQYGSTSRYLSLPGLTPGNFVDGRSISKCFYIFLTDRFL
jgi:hypothetical protein